MIELTFSKELILIKQMHQTNVIFPTIDIYCWYLSLNDTSATDVMTY